MTTSASRLGVTIRARAFSPTAALGAVVAGSFAGRLVVASLKATPVMFPDEYIYSALARSIGETGRPLIRGHSAHFPALLASLLTAPAWLVRNVDVAYALALATGAAAMSLAAVPVFLLARRLGLGGRLSVALAALALLVPDLMYTAFLTAEPFAYPLALDAVLAGAVALERRSRRAQVVFVVLAALATLARVQFVALPIAYTLAVLALGLRERRLRAMLRDQALPLAAFGLAGLALAAVGLGYYSSVLHGSVSPLPLLGAAADNLLVLEVAAGWVIVPGAVLGLALGIARPRGRGELVFCVLASSITIVTLAEAAFYGEAAHERYLFYLAPLGAIAFALYAGRGWPYRLVHGLLAAVLATIAIRVPLTTIAVKGETNSPSLIALHWLAAHVGGTAEASFIVMLWLLGSLAAVVVLAGRAPAGATRLAVVLAACLCGATYLAGADFDRRNAQIVRRAMLPAERSWVDSFGFRDVPLVQTFGGRKTDALNQLFWNRSLGELALLPGGRKVDEFASVSLSVGADGVVRQQGRALTGPLVVDDYGSLVRLRHARVLAAAPNYDLWQPAGAAQLELYFAGRFRDGWTAPRSRIDLWPDRGGRLAGRLRFAVRAPEGIDVLRLQLPDGRVETVGLRAGRASVVSLPVCAAGPWHVRLAFSGYGMSGDRLVSGRTTAPVYRPDPRSCAVLAGSTA